VVLITNHFENENTPRPAFDFWRPRLTFFSLGMLLHPTNL
jgi:hypothetical protein